MLQPGPENPPSMPLLRAGQCQRAGSGNAGAQCGPDIQVRLFNQVIQRLIIECSAGIQFDMAHSFAIAFKQMCGITQHRPPEEANVHV